MFKNAKERQCLKTSREKMPLVRQNTNNCIIAPPSYKIGGECQLGLKRLFFVNFSEKEKVGQNYTIKCRKAKRKDEMYMICRIYSHP
jgi:hypothetical protein